MRLGVLFFILFILAGCATAPENQTLMASNPEMLFNEAALKQVKEGMSVEEVHQIMGAKLVVGYVLQKDTYKPLTIPNAYKVQEIKSGGYLIEYYMESIRQPDGIVSDDELLPLVFQDGKLIGRGWSFVHSLDSLGHPS